MDVSKTSHLPVSATAMASNLSTTRPKTASQNESSRQDFRPIRLQRSFSKNGSTPTTVRVMTGGPQGGELLEITYSDTKAIGNGSFGVVYSAKLVDTNETVAIKRVLQDKRFKNRELHIMRKLDHPNVVSLKFYFYTYGDRTKESEKDEIFLNLVLEYIPETVYRVARVYIKSKQAMPVIFIRLFVYQLFRSLNYLHSLGICHRDIKPQNLLLHPETAVLKICDFGSAKELVRGEANVSYICSRYYRAPELIFGATDYTTQIDIWSAGCILGELLHGAPLFPGDSHVDQVVEIIKILGTPTKEQILEMNPNYNEFRFPQINPQRWSKVFPSNSPREALDLIAHLLDYIPTRRYTAIEVLIHPFFDELKKQNARLPNGQPLPPLFNFSQRELSVRPSLNAQLVPAHIRG